MVIAIIPSRYSSSRFPGKALVPVGDEPMVGRVARRVLAANIASRVVVATDHPEIAWAAHRAGVEVWEDRGEFRSGSDRVAAAVASLGCDAEVVVNVQGDEVLVDRTAMEQAVAALDGNAMGTVAAPLRPGESQDADTVKVQRDGAGRAADFSRQELPGGLAHVGIYAFTRDTLREFTELPTSPRECAEHLEQLRALEQGLRIGVGVVEQALSINRPADLARFLEQRSTTGNPGRER